MAPTLTKISGISGFTKFAADERLDPEKANWNVWSQRLLSRARGVALRAYFDGTISGAGLSAEDQPIYDVNNDFAKSILYDAVIESEHHHLDDTKTAAEQYAALKARHLKGGPVRAAQLLRGIFTPAFDSETSDGTVIADIRAKAKELFEANTMPKTAEELAIIGALHALGKNHPDIQRRLDLELSTGTIEMDVIEKALANSKRSTDGHSANVTTSGGKTYANNGKLLTCWDCGGNHFKGDPNCKEPGAGKFSASSGRGGAARGRGRGGARGRGGGRGGHANAAESLFGQAVIQTRTDSDGRQFEEVRGWREIATPPPPANGAPSFLASISVFDDPTNAAARDRQRTDSGTLSMNVELDLGDSDYEHIAATASAPGRATFTTDSGATCHLSPNREEFVELKPQTGNVRGFNGSSLAVLGVGVVHVKLDNGQTLKLSNVLYVPGASLRLLSVGVLCDKGYTIEYDDTKCYLRRKGTDRRVIATGTRKNGKLYVLDGNIQPAPTTDITDAVALSAVGVPDAVWHRRLGHVNMDTIHRMSRQTLVEGMPLTTPSSPCLCEHCIIGKQKKAIVPKSRAGERAGGILDVVYADLQGPFCRSIDGNYYSLDLYDEHSARVFAIPIPSKDRAAEAIEAWEARVHAETGRRVGIFRSDGGGEFTSTLFKRYLASLGTHRQTSAPHTSAQIGCVERAHGTLMGRVRAMLSQARLPPSLWSVAIRTAAHLSQYAPASGAGGRTPYERWTKTKPDVSHLREFGCRVFVLRDGHNPKWMPKSDEYVFVGYSEVSKGYWVYHRETGKLRTSYNCRFMESHQDQSHTPNLPSSIDISAKPGDKLPREAAIPEDPIDTDASPAPAAIPARNGAGPSAPATRAAAGAPDPLASEAPEPRRSARAPVPRGAEEERVRQAVADASAAAARKRSAAHGEEETAAAAAGDRRVAEQGETRELVTRIPGDAGGEEERTLDAARDARLAPTPLGHLTDPEVARANIIPMVEHGLAEAAHALRFEIAAWSDDENWAALLGLREKPDIPKNARDALTGPRADGWRGAMDVEQSALKKLDVFELIPPEDVPEGENIMGTRFVFGYKTDADGNVVKLKVRQVAQGFTAMPGVDYDKTAAPTARMESLRVLAHVAGANGWTTCTADVRTAYLHGKLDKPVYMRQAKGGEEAGKESWIMKVFRGLYGMKQAGYVWHKTMAAAMKGWGFKRLSADHCLFWRVDGDTIIIVVVHVDDFAAASNNPDEIRRFQEEMTARWAISSGPLELHLGIKIERDLAARTISFSQPALIDRVVEAFAQADAAPVRTPLEAGAKFTRKDCPEPNSDEHREMQAKPFRQLVGSLVYIAIGSRPDIAHAVQHLSQFLANPSHAMWKAGLRVVRYLKATRELRLVLGGTHPVELTGMCDADWMNCPDTRRSVSGYFFSLGSGAISWNSRKQATVAGSSTESEYIAANYATKEAVWLRRMLLTLGLVPASTPPTLILCDNQGSNVLTEDPSFHSKTKHIEGQYSYVRERVAAGEIVFKYVRSSDNISDIFTKALPTPTFERLRRGLGLRMPRGGARIADSGGASRS
jgi:hypothetical protein